MSSLRAIVDLNAVRHNVRLLAATASPAEVMLAVKADAYGHGAVEVARAGLEAGATELAVLDIPTGLLLRAAGLTVPLFAWLHGIDSDFVQAVAENIELGVSAGWQLERIAEASLDPHSRGRIGTVHLKLDTGLTRNGARVADWPELVAQAVELEKAGRIRLRAAWSHLADAGPENDAAALAVFREGLAVADRLGARFEIRHLAASSAGLREPEARFERVRFGIAAYGISPFNDVSGAGLGLRAPMTLETRVISVGDDAGTVGNDGNDANGHAASSETAVLEGGYGDGLLVAASAQAQVLLGGVRASVSEIGPETTTVRCPPGLLVTRGQRAVFFGSGEEGEPTAEDWAAWAGTIGDEVVVRLARVERSYLGLSAP